MKKLYVAIRKNEYTFGQAVLVSAILYAILTVILYATTGKSFLLSY